MIADAHLKMELKFHNSFILSKFDGKSSKVNQVNFFSTPIGIPNIKALAKKLQVGKDQEKAQSERDSHSKNRGGKKTN